MILIKFIQLSITRYEDTTKERQGIERYITGLRSELVTGVGEVVIKQFKKEFKIYSWISRKF